MTNLFRIQPMQVGETHSDVLKHMELVVEFGGVATRKNFLLPYERLIVIIAISLLHRLSQKEMVNRFNLYEI